MTVSDFLSELDDRWPEDGSEKIVLKLIGSAALMLQTNYLRVTKDTDVLQVDPLTPELCGRLEKLAGRGSQLDRRHNMYLEFVRPGLPFLPRLPTWRDLVGLQPFIHFRLQALDIVDVVVSKLARFARADRLPRYIARLHQIERDHFGLPPTNIEIPAGIASE